MEDLLNAAQEAWNAGEYERAEMLNMEYEKAYRRERIEEGWLATMYTAPY